MNLPLNETANYVYTTKLLLSQDIKNESQCVLPPCKICNNKSSGFHYGVNTCEACKVFFRRAQTKFSSYQCIAGNLKCEANQRFIFTCKLCRYNRCLSVGMSRDKCKVGRYNFQHKNKNMKSIRSLNSNTNNIDVPRLISFSDADDFLIHLIVGFESMNNIKLSEIHGLKNILHNAIIQCQMGFFEKDQYKDVLEVAGIEIDGRRSLVTLMDTLFTTYSVKFVGFLRYIPGLKELNNDQFCKLILNKFSAFQFAVVNCLISCDILLGDPNLAARINIGDDELTIDVKNIGEVLNKTIIDIRIKSTNKLKEINLTKEESAFITLLSIVKNNEIISFSYFETIQNRLLISFTRYLQAVYGNEAYHRRLLDIINCMVYFEQCLENISNLVTNEKEYFDFIYKEGIVVKAFNNFNGMNSIECMQLFTKLNIN